MIKNIQVVGKSPVLPIPQVKPHPLDLVAAYTELLATSPIIHPNQPLLTMRAAKGPITLTVPMLFQRLKIKLDPLELDTKLYSLHSLRIGGATATYREGVGQMDIKLHSL